MPHGDRRRGIDWVRRAFVAVVASFLIGAGAPHAGLPSLPPAIQAPQPAPAEDPEAAVARMTDTQVRERLIAELGRSRPGESASAEHALIGEAFLTRYRTVMQRLGDRLTNVAAAAPGLADVPDRLAHWFLPGAEDRAWRIPIGLAWIFAGGLLLEVVCRWAWRGRRLALLRRAEEPPGSATGIGSVGTRLLFDVLGLVAFQIGAICTFFVRYQVGPALQYLALASVTAAVVTRLVAACSRVALAPGDPGRRLVPLEDRAARQMHVRVVIFGALAAFGYLLASLLGFAEVPTDVRLLVLFGLWTLSAADLASAIGAVRFDTASGGRTGAWRPLALVFVVIVYATTTMLGLLTHPGAWLAGLLTLSLLLVVPFIDTVAGAAVRSGERRAVAPSPPAGGTPPSVAPIRRWLRFVLVAAACVATAGFWGIDLFALSAGEGLLARAVRAGIDITITLLLASLAWEAIRTAIDRRIAAEGGTAVVVDPDHLDEGGSVRPVSRLATLLSLLRVFALITIPCVVVMIVLASLGVNIGPLLAGAGIVGLAVGIGSQTLVRDIVSGVFFLLDDAFRLGEYVEIEKLEGTVEKISIRSLRLRHPRGRLHTVPYGEIKHLTNYSRDWAIMKLELRLPFDTDLERVRKVVKRAGQQLLEDPEYGPMFLQPLKSQGVRRMEETAMIVGIKYMTLPMEQFVVRRAVFQAVQKAFEENGIRFARPQIVVEASPDERAPEGQAPAVGPSGAAASWTLHAVSKEDPEIS